MHYGHLQHAGFYAFTCWACNYILHIVSYFSFTLFSFPFFKPNVIHTCICILILGYEINGTFPLSLYLMRLLFVATQSWCILLNAYKHIIYWYHFPFFSIIFFYYISHSVYTTNLYTQSPLSIYPFFGPHPKVLSTFSIFLGAPSCDLSTPLWFVRALVGRDGSVAKKFPPWWLQPTNLHSSLFKYSGLHQLQYVLNFLPHHALPPWLFLFLE